MPNAGKIDVYARENEFWIRIDPRAVNWKRRPTSYRFVQRPHDSNALGRVKFEMENPYGIYLQMIRQTATCSSAIGGTSQFRVCPDLCGARHGPPPARRRCLAGGADDRAAEMRSDLRVSLPEAVSVHVEYRLADVIANGKVRFLPATSTRLPVNPPAIAQLYGRRPDQ